MKTSLFAAVVALLLLSSSPSAVPYIIIDQPYANSPVGRTFTLHGTALNADVVHVWAFPAGPNTPGYWLGAAVPNEIDLGRQLSTGRFSIFVENAPIGTYPVVAYAHDPVTGTFPSQHGRMVEVRTCVTYTMQWFLFGPNGQETIVRPFCGGE